VSIEPERVEIVYRLELSAPSLFSILDRDKSIDIGAVKSKNDLQQACLKRFKVLIPDLMLGRLNGQQVNWTVESASTHEAKDGAANFQLRLSARWQVKPGDNAFQLDDGNFFDAPGAYAMKIDVGEGLRVESFNPPRVWEGSGVDPNREQNRKAAVDFGVGAAEVPRSTAPPASVDEPAVAPPTIWQRLRALWDNIQNENLDYLLSSNYALWLLVLIAFVHGAGHSLMPGHGKTAVAAYLVGERGTPWHAVLLGIVTTLTHTSAAIIIAMLLHYVLPPNSAKDVGKALMFCCGLLMFFVGAWLFLQRLAGRSDHIHLVDVGHGHSHGDSPSRVERAGAVRLVVLGIAGGIIPCWGAIMWVVGCIATGQFWLALPIVLAFSIGLAAVLVLIGLSVVYAKRIGSSRWSERRWFKTVFNERTVRVIPVLGAVIVAAIGLFFCAASGIAAH
jgi:ABC-type nickel/cobalt efflux system permease component RcnA